MPLPPLVAPIAALSAEESARTARHASLYPLGELGQRRLAAAHVAIVGAGGLGSPAVLALAAAGVGHLTVIDDDVVELSNLQRQVLHRVSDVGAAKVDSAVRAASALAPEVTVTAVRERLTDENAYRLLAGADVVLDGTDTFAARRAVAAACERSGVPLVWGAVQEFAAQVTVFWSSPPRGVAAVRLRDLHPDSTADDAPTCAEVGVLGSMVMQTGALMATQAVLLIAGIGDPLVGRIALMDGLRSTAREVPLHGTANANANAHGSAANAANANEPDANANADVNANANANVQDAAATQASPDDEVIYLDVREPSEHATGVIPGAILLPLGDLLADDSIRFDQPVIAVCAHGVRSQYAAAVLASRGVTVTSMDGGMAEWTGPVELPR